jgi:hypothetical protein
MAYYNLIKSLGILEELRKNPHLKIPPKSPCTNFQSLCKFKNPILFPKGILSRLLAPSAHPAYVAHVAQLA